MNLDYAFIVPQSQIKPLLKFLSRAGPTNKQIKHLLLAPMATREPLRVLKMFHKITLIIFLFGVVLSYYLMAVLICQKHIIMAGWQMLD